MSEAWNPKKARKKLRAAPDMLACDALLDQDIFSGVGNIIKNEVLFRIRVHPLSTVGALPPAKLRALVEEARQYSFDFLAWKRNTCSSSTGWRMPRRPARAATSPSTKPISANQPAQFLVRTLPETLRLSF
jgi:formamidopyrimidine-DNA glycosylase